MARYTVRQLDDMVRRGPFREERRRLEGAVGRVGR
jgi:hypothetical protein